MIEQGEQSVEFYAKDGKRRPIKALYAHITGSIWMVWGIARDWKDDNKEVVILAGVDEDKIGQIKFWPLETFFDLAPEKNANGQPNPKAGRQRFELVTPNKV